MTTTKPGIYRGYTTGAFRKGPLFIFILIGKWEIRWFMGTTQIINSEPKSSGLVSP